MNKKLRLISLVLVGGILVGFLFTILTSSLIKSTHEREDCFRVTQNDDNRLYNQTDCDEFGPYTEYGWPLKSYWSSDYTETRLAVKHNFFQILAMPGFRVGGFYANWILFSLISSLGLGMLVVKLKQDR